MISCQVLCAKEEHLFPICATVTLVLFFLLMFISVTSMPLALQLWRQNVGKNTSVEEKIQHTHSLIRDCISNTWALIARLNLCTQQRGALLLSCLCYRAVTWEWRSWARWVTHSELAVLNGMIGSGGPVVPPNPLLRCLTWISGCRQIQQHDRHSKKIHSQKLLLVQSMCVARTGPFQHSLTSNK